MDYSVAFVCLMGMGTVFFGLICIVALCCLMSAVCRGTERKKPAPAAPAVPVRTGDRGELVAAISAALAEELGTDISGIRILSLKKLQDKEETT